MVGLERESIVYTLTGIGYRLLKQTWEQDRIAGDRQIDRNRLI